MSTDAKYFHELAARCRIAAWNCFDLKAQHELRAIGEELAHRAHQCENDRDPIPGKPEYMIQKGLQETLQDS